MPEITPENANSWRDLADELTPEQVAEIEDASFCLGGGPAHIGESTR